MNPARAKAYLDHYIAIARQIQNGLDGKPFFWGQAERISYMGYAKDMGMTLVTRTQIKKRGYRLKRGVKPVGNGYFGAPMKIYADLFVLEVQCVQEKTVDEKSE